MQKKIGFILGPLTFVILMLIGPFESLSQSINNDIKEGIKGLIKGTSTLGDMLNNIADRFLDSTLAYQGGGRELDLNWLIDLNNFATNNTFPDITFFLDIVSGIPYLLIFSGSLSDH